jgi:5'-methylthioadenosine phosphorylase
LSIDSVASPVIQPVIGIIGGSGLYDIDGLEDQSWRQVDTPWGSPSDRLLFGRLAGIQCVFLPRHGRGHPTSPTHLNYRANIDALKRSGVTDVLSLSAVGSLKAELPPGHFVVVDQSSTAASRGRKASSAMASSRTYRWRIRSAPVWEPLCIRRRVRCRCR